MKRGDIVASVGRGDFSSKPRPSLIVQADLFTAYHPSITVCPISSVLTGGGYRRVPIARDEQTKLFADSEIEIDLVQAIKRERIGRKIGAASEDTMMLVDDALRRWLAL
jgi:mRNA interferase MazF